MYPRISDIFPDLFGFRLPFPIYSFGFMLAAAILTASWLLARELNRMQQEGRIGLVPMPVHGKEGKGRRGKTELAPPAEVVGTATVIAAVVGVIGSKIFHIFENFDEFLLDPFAMIFSTGGLTFYGGLLCAAVAVGWYARKKQIPVWAFADAVAPGLMIGYGIGRIGCHLAGDGDWGIAADLSLKPEWLPTWLWAETYPRNILEIDLAAPGVYPTPLYEFTAALLFFGVLWALRKHPYRNGWLFSLYLVLNGIERFAVEQIRVNETFDLFGLVVTQAEVIAVLVFLMGVAGLVLTTKRRTLQPPLVPPSQPRAVPLGPVETRTASNVG